MTSSNDALSRIQRKVRILTWMYAISLVLTFILLCLTWLIDSRIP
jgi:hypothetical protein